MKAKYSSLRKRAEYTLEERRSMLTLIREAIAQCDPVYAVRAAGFWWEQYMHREIRECVSR